MMDLSSPEHKRSDDEESKSGNQDFKLPPIVTKENEDLHSKDKLTTENPRLNNLDRYRESRDVVSSQDLDPQLFNNQRRSLRRSATIDENRPVKTEYKPIEQDNMKSK